jgi:hypothetical protein
MQESSVTLYKERCVWASECCFILLYHITKFLFWLKRNWGKDCGGNGTKNMLQTFTCFWCVCAEIKAVLCVVLWLAYK